MVTGTASSHVKVLYTTTQQTPTSGCFLLEVELVLTVRAVEPFRATFFVFNACVDW
jgi:hypothetical protein